MDEDDGSSPPPFTPPTTEEERLSWLRLIRSPRVGPATFRRLLGAHGSAGAALAALPGIARAAGLADYLPCPEAVARAELDRGRRCGARPMFLGAPDYPPALAAMPDPPPLLWVLGRGGAGGGGDRGQDDGRGAVGADRPGVGFGGAFGAAGGAGAFGAGGGAGRAAGDVLARPAVALVGARNASSLGLRMARRLAAGLGAAGFVTVSGLARGIDGEVHGASLETGTIAVMAGGVDRIYPPEHAALAAAVADRGLRLSDQPPGLDPQARHFPRRNRLIAGLAQALVVVEAAEGSGSLITAREALDLGREVLAVPGHPMDPRAAGCNRLIREGARLVREVEDILEALGPALPRPAPAAAPAPARPPAPAAAPRACPPHGQAAAGAAASGDERSGGGCAATDPVRLHERIVARLGAAPLAEDQLLRDLALPSAEVAPALLFLELSGRIRRAPGGLVALA